MKESKTVYVMVRMTEDLKASIEKHADSENRALSAWVRNHLLRLVETGTTALDR